MKRRLKKTSKVSKLSKLSKLSKASKTSKARRGGGRNSKRRKIKYGGYDTYGYDMGRGRYREDGYREDGYREDGYRKDGYGNMSNLEGNKKSDSAENKKVEVEVNVVNKKEEDEEKTPELREVDVRDWYIGLSGDVPYLYEKTSGCENEANKMIASIEKIENKRTTVEKKRLYIDSIDREKITLHDNNNTERYILKKDAGCVRFKMKGKKKQVGPFIEPKAVKKIRNLFKSRNERIVFDRHWKNNSVKKIFKNAFKKSRKLFNIFK